MTDAKDRRQEVGTAPRTGVADVPGPRRGLVGRPLRLLRDGAEAGAGRVLRVTRRVGRGEVEGIAFAYSSGSARTQGLRSKRQQRYNNQTIIEI